ncbi:hypothetical protein [Streptomyces aidingensis]|uniref:DUF3558 domain-containing protein n=1 Tax=Streptomyces aidingensis TaxID=910347 RepID=A0A1I1I3A2_9ACTN|nr:hypothetical protein [Streptomyces aidingensis]SFC28143.1 hypothetical protein SAMN05421773_102544 [Streptomyces aidingensis]
MDRTASTPGRSRRARRALAWAIAPALMIGACSSPPEDNDSPKPSASATPAPEPVRFSTLPNPCRTVSEETAERVVPGTENPAGEELSSADTTRSGACLWTGLKENKEEQTYHFRSLTLSLKRFDSEPSLGSGDDRASLYLQDQVAEIMEDEANTGAKPAELAETGDEAVTIAYSVKKKDGEETNEYRQQRVVARTGNAVLTVDLYGAGMQETKPPSAESVKKSAELVIDEALAALDAEADAPAEDSTDATDATDSTNEESTGESNA